MASADEPKIVIAVAIGGAVGATARWAVTALIDVRTPDDFPWHTLAVNVIGCLLIGIALQRLERDTVAWGFVATGILGGFTTMSALAVELNDLAAAGHAQLAVSYVAITLAGGLVALLLGERLGRP